MHKFIYKGKIDDRKVYLVKCSKTKGEFSTELWQKGKIQKNKCLCCEEIIR